MTTAVLRSIRNGPGNILFAVALALLMPAAALANSTCIELPGVVCVINAGGQATGGSAGLAMDGTGGSISSTVIQVNGVTGANLGSLTFTTGAFTPAAGQSLGGNSVGLAGTFAPGTLTITLTTPFSGFAGVLFTGTFGAPGAPIQWLYLGKANNLFQYELVGQVSGTYEGGQTLTGITTQVFFSSKTKYTGGAISLANGNTNIVTPEPRTLGLMGTGLVGLGLVFRQKARARD